MRFGTQVEIELSQVIEPQPAGQPGQKKDLLDIKETGLAIVLDNDVFWMEVGVIDTSGMQEGNVLAKFFGSRQRIAA
jgi:hypothetical protein